MENSTIFYPITIFSDVDKVQLFNQVFLRKITDLEIERFFGVTKRKVDDNLGVVSLESTGKGIYNFSEIGDKILANTDPIFSSNYVIEINGDKEGILKDQVNCALKLFGFTKTGICFGFNAKTPALYVTHPIPYYKQKPFLGLFKEQISKFSSLILHLNNYWEDKYVRLILEKYMFAVSGLRQNIENRFLELAIILEMLYCKGVNKN